MNEKLKKELSKFEKYEGTIKSGCVVKYCGNDIFLIKEYGKVYYKIMEYYNNDKYLNKYFLIKKCGKALFSNSPIQAHINYKGKYNDMIEAAVAINYVQQKPKLFDPNSLECTEPLSFTNKSHKRIKGESGGIAKNTKGPKAPKISKDTLEIKRRMNGENHRFCDPDRIDLRLLSKYTKNAVSIKKSSGKIIYIDEKSKSFATVYTGRNFFDKIGQDGWGILQQTNKLRGENGVVKMVKENKNVVFIELFLLNEKVKYNNRIKELKKTYKLYGKIA